MAAIQVQDLLPVSERPVEAVGRPLDGSLVSGAEVAADDVLVQQAIASDPQLGRAAAGIEEAARCPLRA